MVTLGLDEVGRGSWAGPLVAGAVVLGRPIKGLKDSKLLTRAQRLELSKKIEENALAIGLGWVEPATIDKVGLTVSVRLAMQQALHAIEAQYDELIIDGNFNFFPNNEKAKAVIKADNFVPAVSAASIVAKVARDGFMIKMAKQYGKYGFDRHVGYGTALHQQMLKLHGICELHRRSFQPIRALSA
jgi:ribonuclease HII